MDRRAAISVIAACLLAPSGTQAQPIAKIPTLGFLGPPPSAGGLVQAFQSAMRDLGYVEGHNIKVEYRYPDAALQGTLNEWTSSPLNSSGSGPRCSSSQLPRLPWPSKGRRARSR